MSGSGLFSALILYVAVLIPMLRLLPHFGIHRLWALACLFPLVTIILLWIMAYRLHAMERQ